MSARHTPALTSGRPLDATAARAALRYPSVAAVLAELEPGRADWPQPPYGASLAAPVWPEPVRVIVSRRQVLDAHGLTDCEIAHLQALADLAERRRWERAAIWTGVVLALAASAAFFGILWREFIP